ncbi:MAG: hypothetical protein IV092_22775 [Burkholderiaceae bacterium]|nr:hypothetical protein [Burkholderiaceae bacterium]
MKTISHTILLISMLLGAASARAELIDIQWDAHGRFEKTTTVEPGKFAEICSELTKGQSIAWAFKAETPMNFNIHYHEGKKVEFPAKVDGALAAEGKLAVPVDQHYCWMWANKTDKTGQLTLTVQK